NPTIYVSYVKKFWATAKVKKVNDQEHIQALVYKKKVIITEDSIRSDLRFDDAEQTVCLLNEAIFEGSARMGYEKPSQKITFYKAYLSLQWKFLIHTILQCLSAKTIAWNEFSSTMVFAIICLADNQKFNFSRHKKMYIISSHTKKIFANMRRIRAGFSRVITPLFDIIMVQAPADMGDTPVETRQTPIVDQPSTSKPKKKQKPRRKQRKEAEVSHDESEDEKHAPTPSSDPLPSGEDSYTLNELMIFYTSLQEHRMLRSGGLRRLKKIGSGRRVKSPMEKDSLGVQEDASKQGRMIEEIDQNAEIALDDETQGRTIDDEMFRVDDLAGEEVVMDTTTSEHEEHIIEDVSTAEPVTIAGEVVTATTVKDSVALTTAVTEDEITMAQALAALRSPKPKVVVQEKDMSTTILAATTIVTTVVPTPRAKGKAKMIEPEVPIKKKDQIRIDEEYARKLEAEEQEAARLSRAQQDEEANNSWDNIQAMMDADRLLAERIQAREREEFFKGRSFDDIKKLFDREMRKVNDFIDIDLETQKSSAKEVQESSTKRIAEHLESDISKKQKVDENVKPVIDDSEELKKCIGIVPDDGDEVLIEATPLSSRSPTIIDYKIHKEGKKTYFKIIRADGNSQVYQSFEKMFKNFYREDLEVLWAIVKYKFKKEKPVDDMDNLLFRTLKTMFEHHVEDTIWKYQQGLAKVKI
nr:hypothetical protein [Tanacetum cinerariifolium]